MFKVLVMAGVATLLVFSSTPSFAQSIEIGPGGLQLTDPDTDSPYRRYRGISERSAVHIAQLEGVREVDNIRRTRSRFIVEGTDRDGDDISVSVDRSTGEVISID